MVQTLVWRNNLHHELVQWQQFITIYSDTGHGPNTCLAEITYIRSWCTGNNSFRHWPWFKHLLAEITYISSWCTGNNSFGHWPWFKHLLAEITYVRSWYTGNNSFRHWPWFKHLSGRNNLCQELVLITEGSQSMPVTV